MELQIIQTLLNDVKEWHDMYFDRDTAVNVRHMDQCSACFGSLFSETYMLTHIISSIVLMFPKLNSLHIEGITKKGDDISYFFSLAPAFKVMALRFATSQLKIRTVERSSSRIFVLLDLQLCGPVHEGSSQFVYFLLSYSLLLPLTQQLVVLPG